MKDIKIDDDLSQWFSTYGLITAERILGRYQITLPPSDLTDAVKKTSSFFHRLIQIPLKNVLTGIVLDQAGDYHVYVQKIFVDYLLSGESSKDPDAQGASTRQSIEKERKNLITLGDEFNRKQLAYNNFISSSQAYLITFAQQWKKTYESSLDFIYYTFNKQGLDILKSQVRRSMNYALIHCDISDTNSAQLRYVFIDKMNEINKLTLSNELKDILVKKIEALFELNTSLNSKMITFADTAAELSQEARRFRSQFYDTILGVTELINLLPEYKINPDQDVINREHLYFDKTIGES